jgi:hypothetical protein
MAEGRKRVAFYLRVSTGSQSVENQRRELQEVAERSGWEVVAGRGDQRHEGQRSPPSVRCNAEGRDAPQVRYDRRVVAR